MSAHVLLNRLVFDASDYEGPYSDSRHDGGSGNACRRLNPARGFLGWGAPPDRTVHSGGRQRRSRTRCPAQRSADRTIASPRRADVAGRRAVRIRQLAGFSHGGDRRRPQPPESPVGAGRRARILNPFDERARVRGGDEIVRRLPTSYRVTYHPSSRWILLANSRRRSICRNLGKMGALGRGIRSLRRPGRIRQQSFMPLMRHPV